MKRELCLKELVSNPKFNENFMHVDKIAHNEAPNNATPGSVREHRENFKECQRAYGAWDCSAPMVSRATMVTF